MTADELRKLADALEPMACAPRFDGLDVPALTDYLRACADALERGPVGWISPSNPRKDGSDPRQLVQDYEASGGYGFSADTALSRGWAALYPLAMPAPLRLPEPLTDEEIITLYRAVPKGYLSRDGHAGIRLARAIEAETLRRVKEANNG